MNPFTRPSSPKTSGRPNASEFEQAFVEVKELFDRTTGAPITASPASATATTTTATTTTPTKRPRKISADVIDPAYTAVPMPEATASSVVGENLTETLKTELETPDLFDRKSGWIFTLGVASTMLPTAVAKIFPTSQSAVKVLSITDFFIHFVVLVVLCLLAYGVSKGHSYAAVLFVQVALAFLIPTVFMMGIGLVF